MEQQLTAHTNKIRIVFSIVLMEFLLFVISGVSFSFLAGNNFFSLEADPVPWLFYFLQIPQFITAHQWLGISLDIAIIALFLLVIRKPFNNRLAIILFILLLLFYVTLMGHLAHHNYQFGFCLVFIPFLFSNELSKKFAFEATRYFMLFFYLSAALLKIYYGNFTNPAHLSNLISGQFTPYFLEGNTGIRTEVNLFLINHTAVSQFLFIASIILELVIIVGFFTKRYDKGIAILILLFHFCNWFMMDIAPFGQIGFVCLLFLSKELKLAIVK